MTQKPKILVTSAGGNTGLHVTLKLCELGYPTRAFLRRADHRVERTGQPVGIDRSGEPDPVPESESESAEAVSAGAVEA